MKITNSLDKECKKKTRNREHIVWTIRISVLAFAISLTLSMFSEIILVGSNLIIALILLLVFTSLNVFSDMIGLAITSCQIQSLHKNKIGDALYEKCLYLIKNSDKVSSILCDVVGDISSILCGASGTMIAMIISSFFNFQSVNILIVSLVSSVIAGLTVLFKAIVKKYAINNSVKIVVGVGKILKMNKKFWLFFKRKGK